MRAYACAADWMWSFVECTLDPGAMLMRCLGFSGPNPCAPRRARLKLRPHSAGASGDDPGPTLVQRTVMGKRGHGGADFGAEITLRRDRGGGERVLVVRVRSQQEPAILRRLAQGDGPVAAAVHGGEIARGLVLRLQADRRQAALRQHPQPDLNRSRVMGVLVRAAPAAAL